MPGTRTADRQISDPIKATLELGGKPLDWQHGMSYSVVEGISTPPVLNVYRKLDQTAQQKDNLASHIKNYLDKSIALHIDGKQEPINIYLGTVTRVGTLRPPPEEEPPDVPVFLRDRYGDLLELPSFGAHVESERGIRSTPEVRGGGVPASDDTLVIGGANAMLESMQKSRRCRIFENKTYFDMIEAVADEHGLTVRGDKGPTGAMAFVVQYQESDYNFMMRLLQEAGLVYTVECEDFMLMKKSESAKTLEISPQSIDSYEILKGSEHSLTSTVIANDPSSFEIKKGMYDGASLKNKINSAGDVSGELFESIPEVRDRFTPSGLNLLAEQASGIGELYAGLGWIKFHCKQSVVRPGDKLTIAGACDVHVQSVEHFVEADDYQCVATAVLAGLPYHIWQQPYIPRIYGPQTARVVSNLDPEKRDLRVQVQFHWPDEAGTLKPKAWIRVVQPWAGAEHGAQFIPQVDDEVVVEFMNGDPNFPLITGSVYNGKQKVFYPEHKEEKLTTTAIKTRSNELRIDDEKNEEIVEITAKKSFHTYANDKKAEIKADDTKINIQHKEKPINVTADGDAITVKATQKTILLEAGTSITLKVGQNQIVIDKKGVTIKGMQVGVDGTAGTEVKSSAITTVKGMLVQIN